MKKSQDEVTNESPKCGYISPSEGANIDEVKLRDTNAHLNTELAMALDILEHNHSLLCPERSDICIFQRRELLKSYIQSVAKRIYKKVTQAEKSNRTHRPHLQNSNPGFEDQDSSNNLQTKKRPHSSEYVPRSEITEECRNSDSTIDRTKAFHIFKQSYLKNIVGGFNEIHLPIAYHPHLLSGF